MSSSLTGPTSTIVSSTCCPSRAETGPDIAVIACGALGARLRAVLAERRLRDCVEVHCLPPLLHNRPQLIAGEVERLARRLLESHAAVAVAYADCGTYGALGEVCDRLGLARLAGLHCYDVIAGADRVTELMEDEPGTYLLTDFLLAGFRRLVVAELGLDRHPELRADYFGNYRRVVWLAEKPTEALEREATAVAALMGLPLVVVPVGTESIDRELVALVEQAATRR